MWCHCSLCLCGNHKILYIFKYIKSIGFLLEILFEICCWHFAKKVKTNRQFCISCVLFSFSNLIRFCVWEIEREKAELSAVHIGLFPKLIKQMRFSLEKETMWQSETVRLLSQKEQLKLGGHRQAVWIQFLSCLNSRLFLSSCSIVRRLHRTAPLLLLPNCIRANVCTLRCSFRVVLSSLSGISPSLC